MTETTILFNLNPPHRKYYIVELHQQGIYYTVTGIWGRVNAKGRTLIKYQGPERWIAKRVAEQEIQTRYDHGYTLHETNNNRAQASVSLVEALLSAL